MMEENMAEDLTIKRKEEEEEALVLLLHFDQTNRVIMHLLYSTSMYVRGMFSQRAKHTFD